MYLTNTQRSDLLDVSFDFYEHARDLFYDYGGDDAYANAMHDRADYLQWLAYFLGAPLVAPTTI